MKKTVRTYTKRTISVLMAALMLLTAWVFVAPQKAAAVNGVTKYTISFVVDNSEHPGLGSSSSDYSYVATIYGYATYGTVETISTIATEDVRHMDDDEHTHTIDCGTTVPSGITLRARRTNGGQWYAVSRTFTGVFKNVQVTATVNGSSQTVATISGTLFSYNNSGKNTWDQTYGTNTNVHARPSSITTTLSTTSSSVNVPSSGSASKTFTSYAKDSDNVLLSIPGDAGSLSTTLTDSSSLGVSTSYEDGTSAVTHTVTVPSSAHGSGHAVKSASVKVKYTSGSRTNEKTYTLTVNDYSKVVLNANSGTIKNSSGTSVAGTYYTYDGKLTSSQVPNTSQSTRLGYTYKGMYPTRQTNNTTPDGSWTPTGTPLSTSTDNTADCTWYAAWQAKDVKLYFQNVEDDFLCTDNKYHALDVDDDGFPLATQGFTPKAIIGKYDARLANNQELPNGPDFNPGGTYNYDFAYWQVVTSREYTTPGSNAQAPAYDKIGQKWNTVTLKGDTVLKAIYNINASPATYDITYLNGSTTPIATESFEYRAEGRPATDPTYAPTPEEAKTYTYEFLGWAEQVHPEDTVYFQTWDGAKFEPRMYSETPLRDTRVYHDATWVAVYGRKYIDYTVDFVYTNRELQENGTYSYTTGASHPQTLHYDKLVAIPQYNVDVFNYAGSGVSATNLEGKKYFFTGWDNNAVAADAATVAPAALTFTAPVPDPVTGIYGCSCTVTAQYRAEDAVYHILFKDYDGTVLNCSDPTHEEDDSNLTADNICCFTFNDLIENVEDAANANNAVTMEGVQKATRIWQEDGKEYRFIGWKPAVTLDQNNEMRAKDDAVYVADYEEVPLYNVTYMNGDDVVATIQGAADRPVPCYPEPFREPDWEDPDDEGEPPTKEGDEYADVYYFAGWALTPYEWSENPSVIIPAGAESTFNTPADEDGTVLYAQYLCDAKEYTVNFIYDDVVNAETGEHGMKDHPIQMHYNETLEPPAVPQKPNDETYTYTFFKWDNNVTSTCTGDATYTAQYTKGYVYYDAVWYQPDLAVDEDTNAYTQQAAQTLRVNGNDCIYFAPAGPTKNDAYIYNSVIFPPVQDPNLPAVKRLNEETQIYEEDNSQQYVLAGWIYKDTLNDPDGPTLLGPTDKMQGAHISTEDLAANREGKIEFIPIFRLSDTTVQITFEIPEGESVRTETKTVVVGTRLNEISVGSMPVQYVNDSVHHGFAGWHAYLGLDPDTAAPIYDENQLPDDYAVTENITVRAAFAESAHTWRVTRDNIVTQPTFQEPGIGYAVCPVCSHRIPVQLDALQDEAIPTGRVMIQDKSWNTVSDYSGPGITVAAENNFFIHTVDTAFVATPDLAEGEPDPADPNKAGTKMLVKMEERTEEDETVYIPVTEGDEATPVTVADVAVPAFNEANGGSGTQSIYVCATKTILRGNPEQTMEELDALETFDWSQVFDFDAYLKQNPGATQANFSTKLSDIIDLLPVPEEEGAPMLANGENFWLYVKIVDYSGNINYFSTGTLKFDAEKPEVTVSDTIDHNKVSLKHCEGAYVWIDDTTADWEVKKDGKPFTVDDADRGPNWFYLWATDAKPASYIIIVTDEAGNTTRKIVELRGAHAYQTVSTPATCTENGQTSQVCRYCGYVMPGSVSEISAPGHKLRFRVQQPTCIANGSVAVSCKVCGEPIKDLVDGFTAENGIYDTEEALNALLVTDENGQPFVDEETGEPIEPTTYGYLVAKNAHTWGAAEIAPTPTCSRFGVVKYTCDVCGEMDIISGETLEYEVYEEMTAALPERLEELKEDYKATYQEEFYNNLGNPEYEYESLEAALAAAEAKAEEDAFAEIEAAAPLIAAANREHPQKDDEKCASDLVNLDPVNGHSWNRKIQTKQPTCTEQGETYRECRWNDAHHLTVQPIPPTGHVAADEWTVIDPATCEKKGLKVKYCKEGCTETVEVPVDPDDPENTETREEERRVIVEQEEIPMTDHTWEVDTSKDPYTVAPYQDEHGEWQQGYTWYKCSVCGEEEKRDFVDPEEKVTFTFVTDDTETPIELTKGASVTADQAPSTEKTDPAYTYTFTDWVKAVWQESVGDEEGKWVLTEDVITLPYEVNEDTRVVATYSRKEIDYRVTFLYDNGTKLVEVVKGFERYDQTVDIADPQKAATEESEFRFDGWIEVQWFEPAEGEEGTAGWQPVDASAAPTRTVVCKGEATYLAVFTEEPITHTVTWADCNNVELKTITIRGGGNATSQAPALPTQATKEPTARQHWTINGWDTDVSHVTEDIIVRPKQVLENHNITQHTEEATCTEGDRVVSTCSICGYSYFNETGDALGHDYKLVSRTNPTETANGTKVEKCSRCNDTKTSTLTPIFLKVTVKDTNGNLVSGVWVSVFDDDVDPNTPIGGRATDGNGVATIVVPEAKTYRIVVEGKPANVTVDQNGNITGGSVPTVSRGNSGGVQPSHKCDCTCHQSGFWPTIYRFFHKIIKLITGEYRCCTDANY